MKRNLLILLLLCFSFKAFAQWSNTSDNTTIGKLGIGIAPLTKFHINNNDWHIQLENSDPGGSSWFIGSSSNGWNASGGKFIISPNSSSSSSLFTISNLGFVGIGTPNPNSGLEIAKENNTLVLGTGASYGWSNANGIIGFLGSGIAHGQMAFYPSKKAFGFINSSAVGPADDYGDLSWDRQFINIWANDGVFKGNLITRFIATNNDEINNTNGGNLYLGFRTTGNTILQANGGNVAIGTSSLDPNYKLSVNGKIRATEIKVETGWADFVFEPKYKLRPLSEVERFIKENKHLPDIPSAKEVEKDGVSVGEMEAKLLQKIEELTLYLIEQNKVIESHKLEIDKLKKGN